MLVARIGPSRKETWLAMMTRGEEEFFRFSSPLILIRKKRRKSVPIIVLKRLICHGCFVMSLILKEGEEGV